VGFNTLWFPRDGEIRLDGHQILPGVAVRYVRRHNDRFGDSAAVTRSRWLTADPDGSGLGDECGGNRGKRAFPPGVRVARCPVLAPLNPIFTYTPACESLYTGPTKQRMSPIENNAETGATR